MTSVKFYLNNSSCDSFFLFCYVFSFLFFSFSLVRTANIRSPLHDRQVREIDHAKRWSIIVGLPLLFFCSPWGWRHCCDSYDEVSICFSCIRAGSCPFQNLHVQDIKKNGQRPLSDQTPFREKTEARKCQKTTNSPSSPRSNKTMASSSRYSDSPIQPCLSASRCRNSPRIRSRPDHRELWLIDFWPGFNTVLGAQQTKIYLIPLGYRR